MRHKQTPPFHHEPPTLTHAVVSSVDLHVVHGADAGVVPDGVVTLAWAADARILTLIHI